MAHDEMELKGLLSNPSGPIPAHQVFVLLPCSNDLVTELLRVDAHATSKWHLEGFEGVRG